MPSRRYTALASLGLNVGAVAPPGPDVGAAAPPKSDVGAAAPPKSDVGPAAPPKSDVGAAAPPKSDVGAAAPPGWNCTRMLRPIDVEYTSRYSTGKPSRENAFAFGAPPTTIASRRRS